MFCKSRQCILLSVWLLLAGASSVIWADQFSALYAYVKKNYGTAAEDRVKEWKALVQANQNLSEQEKLIVVNDFFNAVPFVSDQKHWSKKDYWATPVELLGTDGGDCEDYSVAKYFTLRELGIPIEKMSLTYVKALELNQAHMVLTYYSKKGAEPLILDNLKPDIRKASLRKDLKPVYTFNGDSLWLAKARGRGQLVGKSSRLKLWVDLVRRIEQEGK
ncbi:MAG: sulfate adenylyltransferase [Methylococcales bacterium]|jgi:predicted transglutaminase-like cysteine proteinase|nr:sulfate adenylyltransferase [Methylococcales bacterium]MBT7445710.1 sulfate adenylyltransferase [Methylococcales bacterium]